MDPLPIIALVVMGMLYGLGWHNKPAREPGQRAIEREAFLPRSNKSSDWSWDRFAIWSFVAVSFMALIFTGFVIWSRWHS